MGLSAPINPANCSTDVAASSAKPSTGSMARARVTGLAPTTLRAISPSNPAMLPMAHTMNTIPVSVSESLSPSTPQRRLSITATAPPSMHTVPSRRLFPLAVAAQPVVRAVADIVFSSCSWVQPHHPWFTPTEAHELPGPTGSKLPGRRAAPALVEDARAPQDRQIDRTQRANDQQVGTQR